MQRRIMQQSYNAFRRNCWKRLESVVYWYGVESSDLNVDVIAAVAIPDAKCYNTHYEVSAEKASAVGEAMIKNSLVCLAQFHTHPGKNTKHSQYDDLHSLSIRNGFLSLVAPDYGCKKDLEMDKVSVHEAWDANWYRLTKTASKQRILVVEDVVDLRDDG